MKYYVVEIFNQGKINSSDDYLKGAFKHPFLLFQNIKFWYIPMI